LVALLPGAVAAINGKQMGHGGAAHLLLRQGAEVVSTDISNELVERSTAALRADGHPSRAGLRLGSYQVHPAANHQTFWSWTFPPALVREWTAIVAFILAPPVIAAELRAGDCLPHLVRTVLPECPHAAEACPPRSSDDRTVTTRVELPALRIGTRLHRKRHGGAGRRFLPQGFKPRITALGTR
jgi:hypothetical protein